VIEDSEHRYMIRLLRRNDLSIWSKCCNVPSILCIICSFCVLRVRIKIIIIIIDCLCPILYLHIYHMSYSQGKKRKKDEERG